MQIKTDNEATRRFYNEAVMGEHYDPPGIEFSSDGVARVKREVGEALVASDDYPGISAVDPDTDTSESDPK